MHMCLLQAGVFASCTEVPFMCIDQHEGVYLYADQFPASCVYSLAVMLHVFHLPFGNTLWAI